MAGPEQPQNHAESLQDLEFTVLSKSERRRLARLASDPTAHETPEERRTRHTRLIKQWGIDAGFSRIGIARARALPQELEHLQRWLAAGMHGPLLWMAEDAERRCDPLQIVPEARCVIVAALDYDPPGPRTREIDLAGEDRVWISRYAWGEDYHLVMQTKLRQWSQTVKERLTRELGQEFRRSDGQGDHLGPLDPPRDFRWSVDFAPVHERAWAQLAGLGWRGKHSLLIHPKAGSLFFLATAVTTLDLDVDQPFSGDMCGSCTACIDACPTQAIVAERVVDARRCLSAITIESDGAIAANMRDHLHDQAFGCDLCQDACPWNRFAPPVQEPRLAAREGLVAPLRQELLDLSEEQFRRRFARSPLLRRGYEGLRDNLAAIGEARAKAQTGEPKGD